jgi:hypothetical protein
MQSIRPIFVTNRRERVLLQQIVDRDLTFVLDVRIGPANRFLIEDYGDETPFGPTMR